MADDETVPSHGRSEKGPQNHGIAQESITSFNRSISSTTQPFSMPQEEEVNDWSGKRALIFSPHQDDEVLGCGGTIKRLLDVGCHVKVVYLTDGSMGSKVHEDDLAKRRRQEAIRGLECLGCHDYSFMDFPDGMLEYQDRTMEAVKNSLNVEMPDAVFLPNLWDGPSDHVVTSALVSDSLKDYPRQVTCFNYEIWNPIMPNCIVDITNVMEFKLNAIAQHLSQMKIVNFADKFRGLNAYRSIYIGGAIHAEAFLKLSKMEQIALRKEQSKNSPRS